MIESFVDLTYRGLSLGRRIKLTRVRPSSGTLELPSPMPVGTHLAIATDDGVTFDATVSWVHEQTAGSDRTPGMVVVPAIAGDPAASWWKARVTLPDEEKPKPKPPREPPMTVRPRTHTDPAPPPEEAVTEEEIPTILSDLTVRVAAPPGFAQPDPPASPGGQPTMEMNALDQQALTQLTPSPHGEPAARTDDHAVIDDGKKTMLMPVLDPATLGHERDASGRAGTDRDPGAHDDPEGAEADGDEADDGDASEANEAAGTATPAASAAPAAPAASAAPAVSDKPAGRGLFKKRRKRR